MVVFGSCGAIVAMNGYVIMDAREVARRGEVDVDPDPFAPCTEVIMDRPS